MVLQGILEEVNLLQEITEACRTCVRSFVEDRTDSQGQVSIDSFANIARNMGFQKQPWEEALKVQYPHPLHKSECIFMLTTRIFPSEHGEHYDLSFSPCMRLYLCV